MKFIWFNLIGWLFSLVYWISNFHLYWMNYKLWLSFKFLYVMHEQHWYFFSTKLDSWIRIHDFHNVMQFFDLEAYNFHTYYEFKIIVSTQMLHWLDKISKFILYLKMQDIFHMESSKLSHNNNKIKNQIFI